MSLSIDELTTTYTTDEVVELWLSELETLGVPARSWRKGGPLRVILKVVATMYAAWTLLWVAFVKSGFLDTASGGWLTLLARYVYGVERVSASFATGTVRLTNSGGGVYNQAAGSVRLINSTSGKGYVNSDGFTLLGSSFVDVTFLAEEAGTVGSAAPDEIDRLETVLLNVTCSNAVSLIGTNEQTDPELRDACRAKLGTLSPMGPRGSYLYAVLNAKRADGSNVDINRVWVSPSSSTGKVTIYAASPSGTPIAQDLLDARANVLKIAATDTATVDLFGATSVATAKDLTVWARSSEGLTEAEIEEAVEAALESFVATYPIGGIAKPPSASTYIYASGLEGAAKSAHASIFAVDGVGGDIPLSVGQVPSLTSVVTVRLVDVGGS